MNAPVATPGEGANAGAEAPAVLVLAYAFPPIQVQMSPVVARLVAGLHALGLVVDVICADPAAASLPRDPSLVDYVESRCRRILRLRPTPGPVRILARRFRRWRDFPDCMGALHRDAYRAVMAADPGSYRAVLTVSPFHSVNPVMVRVKRAYPTLRWIAHFCDPWSHNPLEPRRLVRLWSRWAEARTLRVADFVTHSSEHALDAVLRHFPFLERARTRVVPHVFDRALFPARPKDQFDLGLYLAKPECWDRRTVLGFGAALLGRGAAMPYRLAFGDWLARHPRLERVIPKRLVGVVGPPAGRRRRDKIVLRFVGTLFGRRTPAPLLLALAVLIARRAEFAECLRLELIGPMDRPLSAWPGAAALPPGLVRHVPSVNYGQSLELMYDADLLIVIEADVAATPFVPSKVMDYMGADTPIIGIAPPGGCQAILAQLGCPVVAPADFLGIAAALEAGVERILRGAAEPWCDDRVRRSFDLTSGAAGFARLIMESVPA